MNENLDLCKILEGCKGIKLYSPIFGDVTLTEIFPYEIQVTTTKNTCFGFGFNGCCFGEKYPDGECLLFPSKDQRDWSKFVKPIPINTPMMCQAKDSTEWMLNYYADYHDGWKKHGVYTCGLKSTSGNECVWTPKYMIPYDKFDPNDIEESLKYNIQK